MVRGFLVGIGAWIVSCWFIILPVHNIWILVCFALIGGGILGSLGLISAICSDKWDHIAAVQHFVIIPLSFLSGAFYSIKILPDFWQKVSFLNPFFYLIDGFRYGFLGRSDISVVTSFFIVTGCFILVSFLCLLILHRGYKLRS